MYWKDIKDSTDLEDLEGFLAKFPSGIYADLARRRLKNLGAPSGKDVDVSITRLFTAASNSGMDKTLVVPRPPDVDGSAVAAADVASTAPIEAVTPAEPTPETAASKTETKSKAMVILVGVAVLAVSGVAAKLMSGSDSPVAQVAGPPLTASAPAAPAPPASSPLPAATPASVASKAAAVVPKKTAPEKYKPTKVVPVKAPTPGAPAADKAVATAASPRAACEDRILLGFQSCMAEQCAKPVFTNHPICVERRAMDERRREAERNR